ncbi:MAG: M48 family metallopeptidase [Phycisphaerae bacterium]
MAFILIALGTAIGVYVHPQQGAVFGAGIAVIVWLVLWLIAVAGGDGILLSSVKAREITKDDAPQLWNVVEEMTIASGLGRMPRVYVIDDNALNAFAVGRNPEKAAVAVTSGLLRKLNRDELQGVVAHEIGHIRNLDVKFMTLAGVMVGSIVLISDVFLRGLFYGGGRRRTSSSKGGGQAQAIMLVIAIALAILGPLVAQLLYFACSRRREYLADASAARFTRYPEGLASALERISKRASAKAKAESKPNRVMAPMYIVNPLQAKAAFSLTSTHPPTEKRVQILRSMGGQAGFVAYEAAYRKAMGAQRGCLGARTLEGADAVATRPPTPEPEKKQQAVARAREVTDLLDRMADFLFLSCVCGVRIKVPPDVKREKLECPRCGREHAIPAAELAVVAAATATAVGRGAPGARRPPPPPPMRYKRTGQGWESFRCACGHTLQLSPSFAASFIRCAECRNRIEIDGGGR